MNRKTTKSVAIRSSTAEFLIFTNQVGSDSIEVRYQDGTIWLTQKMMAELFGVGVPTINEHLGNIFKSGELDPDSVIRKFRITAAAGKAYNTQFYNLDAIISVGYRVNSIRATQFRRWATQVLREYAIKGYVLDRERMENGVFLGEDRAERKLPMTMEDWKETLDGFLKLTDREILEDAGRISADIARNHAESEFERYRIIQDRMFESDFDKEVAALKQAAEALGERKGRE